MRPISECSTLDHEDVSDGHLKDARETPVVPSLERAREGVGIHSLSRRQGEEVSPAVGVDPTSGGITKRLIAPVAADAEVLCEVLEAEEPMMGATRGARTFPVEIVEKSNRHYSLEVG